MGRTGRLTTPDYCHLIHARGNAGTTLFSDSRDYVSYLEHVREMVREQWIDVLAFALLKKEIRLLIQPRNISIAKAMQRLHTRHAKWINNRLERRGHVFEGRFQSMLVAPDWLGHAVRYIHLCPVRMGLCKRVHTYQWSSHKTYVHGRDPWSDMVDTWSVLSTFASVLHDAQRAFDRFVEVASIEEDRLDIPMMLHGVVGDVQFAEKILAETHLGTSPHKLHKISLAKLLKQVCLLTNTQPEDVLSSSRMQNAVFARRVIAFIGVRYASWSTIDMAQFLYRDKSQISRLVQQGMEQSRQDEALKQLLQHISEGVSAE